MGSASPPGISATVGVGLLVSLVPMVPAVFVGLHTTESPVAPENLGWTELMWHNSLVGLAVMMLGWLSGGTLAVALTAFSSVINGLAMGAHIRITAVPATFERLPPLAPELLAFSMFAAAGLYGLPVARSVIEGVEVRQTIVKAGVSSGQLLLGGLAALAVAALAEARV